MIRLPPADRALPGLAMALDGPTMARLLRGNLGSDTSDHVDVEACRPEYVRYKPATSCLIAYRLRVRLASDDVQEISAHVRLFAGDGARQAWARPSMQRLLERAGRRHATLPGGGAVVVPEIGGLLQVFPVDRDLPQLVRAVARPKMGRLVADLLRHESRVRVRVDTVRYRPGRKALLRYEVKDDARHTLYGKCYASDLARHQLRLAFALASAGVPVAPALGTIDPLEMVVHAAVPGRPLLELRDRAEYESSLRHVAGALGDLHQARVDGLTGVPGRYDAGLVQRSAETLAVLLPEHGAWVRELAAGIAAELGTMPEKHAVVHGDFYDDQVLVGPDGVTLLDFDEARLGHPLVDVGNFLAHVSAKLRDTLAADGARHTFRDEYLRRAGGDARSVAVFEASAMLQLAVGPFRRLEPDWPAAISRLLRLTEERLHEGRRTRSVAADAAHARPSRFVGQDAIARALAGAYSAPVQIERSELVRHKEGRRSVFRHDVRIGRNGASQASVVYAKVFASRRSESVHAASLALWSVMARADEAPRVPRPLAVLPDEHTVLHEDLPGRPIIDRLLSADVELASAVARSLHAFHASGARLARKHGLQPELAPLDERVERLAAALPNVADAATRCLDVTARLGRRRWPWRWLPIHRDFYPQHVLVDGDRIGFLDLDDAAISEPAVDVANFVAHLRLERLRRPIAGAALAASASSFLAAYRLRDPALDRTLVAFLEGTTLLRLAHIHPQFAPRLLEESERCLLNSTR